MLSSLRLGSDCPSAHIMACTTRQFSLIRFALGPLRQGLYSFENHIILGFNCQQKVIEKQEFCHLQFVANDLTADGLGQFVTEYHNTGVLIGCGMLLDVVLNFLL